MTSSFLVFINFLFPCPPDHASYYEALQLRGISKEEQQSEEVLGMDSTSPCITSREESADVVRKVRVGDPKLNHV